MDTYKTLENADMTPFRSISAIFTEREAVRLREMKSPFMPDLVAITYMALSCLIMAYAILFKFVSILIFYALWLPYLHRILKPTKTRIAALLLPSLALLSTVWSDYPRDSLYSAGEYTSLIVITLIIATCVSTRAYMRGIIVGATLVLIASLVSGKYDLNMGTGASALMGLFGSKNQVGQFAEIGILFAFLHVCAGRRNLLFSTLPVSISIFCLYASKSASSIVSLVVTLGTLTMFYGITRLPVRSRGIVFLGALFLIVTIAAAAISLNGYQPILKSLGKDATLTGRTLLWNRGFIIGEENPWLGHGYNAFWVKGNLRAEQLWFDYDIPNKTGFHFHNGFIETFVELGAAGLAIIVGLFAVIFKKSISRTLRYGMHIENMLPLALAVMFFTRAIVEVDLIGTFSISPILFFSILPRLNANENR